MKYTTLSKIKPVVPFWLVAPLKNTLYLVEATWHILSVYTLFHQKGISPFRLPHWFHLNNCLGPKIVKKIHKKQRLEKDEQKKPSHLCNRTFLELVFFFLPPTLNNDPSNFSCDPFEGSVRPQGWEPLD